MNQPVANDADDLDVIAVVRLDVPARNVGQPFLIFIAGLFEDQGRFAIERGSTKTRAAMVEPEFERHVEAGIFAHGTGFAAAEIVYAVFRPPDQFDDAVQPVGGVVGVLGSYPGIIAKVGDTEGHGLEQRWIFIVKRAVDENRSFKWRRGDHSLGGCRSVP